MSGGEAEHGQGEDGERHRLGAIGEPTAEELALAESGGPGGRPTSWRQSPSA